MPYSYFDRQPEVRMLCGCGPLRRGLAYTIVGGGFDYWTVRCGGKSVFVDKSLCYAAGAVPVSGLYGTYRPGENLTKGKTDDGNA